MYHFFEKQLQQLPEISARVASLVRLNTLYLRPWAPPPGQAAAQAAAAQKAAGAGAAGGGAGAAPAAGGASTAEGRARALQAAEAWTWAPFVRTNYLLYVRLLVSMAREVRLGRFRNFHEKRDLIMLREAIALFSSPHLLLLMRQLGEALEQILQGGGAPLGVGGGGSGVGGAGGGAGGGAAGGAGGARLREALAQQLILLEGPDPQRWRPACDAYRPTKVYEALDGMDRELQTKLDEHKKKQSQKSFFEGSGDTSSKNYVAFVEELRRFAQHCMRELAPSNQPAASAGPAVEAHANDVRIETKLLRPARPLTDAERDDVGRGRARCSRLRVPYRTTPRQPIRPVGSGEVAFLVELTEQLAARLPPRLTRLGVHPRILASVPSVCLCVVYAILLALRPRSAAASQPATPPADAAATGAAPAGGAEDWEAAMHAGRQQLPAEAEFSLSAALLSALWWLLLLLTMGVGVLYVLYWVRKYKPSRAAAASSESWVPWLAEQLARGTSEEELRAYLRRALPDGAFGAEADGGQGDDDAMEAMLSRARERLRFD
jgi:hypothetical protein